MRIGLSYHGGDTDYDAYVQALQRRARALGVSIETPWLAASGHPAQLDLIDRLDGIVFTGGPDVAPSRYGFDDVFGVCRTKPERDDAEWQILERLALRPLPVLAVCRGAQLLNVFHGGTLIPDLAEKNVVHRRNGEERRAHEVTIEPQSRLAAIAGVPRGVVNTSHHQAVDRIAPGFRVSAWSDDGVVEAYEPTLDSGPFLLAVQWHPEAMTTGLPLADRVLDAFLTATP